MNVLFLNKYIVKNKERSMNASKKLLMVRIFFIQLSTITVNYSIDLNGDIAKNISQQPYVIL